MSTVYKINDLIELRLEDGQTQIYLDGEQFRICKYLLLNVDVAKPHHELDEAINIDEAAKVLNREHETRKAKFDITPEQEFIAHCSNLQAWVENDYNPNLLHSNLAVPFLRELALKDVKVFHSLLYHLDDNWTQYKSLKRRQFIYYRYKKLVENAIKKHNVSKEDQNLSIFLKTCRLIAMSRELHYKIRRKKLIFRQKRIKREKARFLRWESKLWGTGKENLKHRHLLRRIRDLKDRGVSDPMDYLPYLYSTNKFIKAGRIDYIKLENAKIIIRDERGIYWGLK